MAKKTQERFMAFIDIMGFQNLVASETYQNVLKKLESISNLVTNIKKVNKGEVVKNEYKGEKLKPFIFSDSIVIFTTTNTLESIRLLLFACNYIFSNSIKSQIPIKGAISHGMITIDVRRSIFFGQPIIDSYLLHNQIKYYGLVLHHSAEKKISEFQNGFSNYSNLIKKVGTPTETGPINYYNLKYDLTKNVENRDEDIQCLEAMYLSVSGNARRYVDNTLELYKKLHEF